MNFSEGIKKKDRVKVIVKPFYGKLGKVERVNGAYIDVRLDDSKHPKDIHEFYPCELKVVQKGGEMTKRKQTSWMKGYEAGYEDAVQQVIEVVGALPTPFHEHVPEQRYVHMKVIEAIRALGKK